MRGTSSRPWSRWIVVDSERRVMDGTADELREGTLLDPSSWLGAAVLRAVEEAETFGAPIQRVAHDAAADRHLLVQASVSRDPWRARVVLVDASAAVFHERAAVVARLAHVLRNVMMALRTVVDTIDVDRPQGTSLDPYLTHLRAPTDRLAETVEALEASLPPTHR